LSVYVVEIDGKPVDTQRTSEFLMAPGTHVIKVRVWHDLRWGVSAQRVTDKSSAAIINVSSKEAFIEIPKDFAAGHTYIPNAQLLGERASAFLDDVGTDFKQECMPLRRSFSDGKSPGC